MSKLILPKSHQAETIDLGRVLPKGNPNQKVQPLTNHVLLKEAAPEDQQAIKDNGIINPNTRSLPLVLRVVAIGPGQMATNGHLMPMNAAVGDLVIANVGAAVLVVHEGVECAMVQDPDIKAVIK